jgi:Bacterial archaeo-eukaryotic release factor family 2
MELDFLSPLYARPGPFASVYLDTTRATEDAQERIDLRWRALRGELERAGADTATLDAVAAEVGADKGEPGRHGQAIFAAGGEVLLAEVLPHPPVRDEASWGPLPRVAPLLAERGERVPHVLVVIDRLGADVTAVGTGEAALEKQVQGDATYPIRKVHPGGWSQSRFQNAAEENWADNAGQVADEVARLAAAVGAELVLVAGDVRARALLRDKLPETLRHRFAEVESGGRAAGADEEPMRAQVRAKLREKAAEHVAEVVDEFRRELGQRDRAVDGLAPVVAALRRGQVSRLLVRADADMSRPLWCGPDPLQLGLDQSELAALGSDEPVQDRADAVMLRALTRAEGDLTIVPAVELRDGVGAVLRFADASTQR